jgi:hypothetical protein
MDRPCKTPGCEGKCLSDRDECSKCKSRKYRKNNPLMAYYHSLKSKAKHRGRVFDITYSEWCRWCEETGYMELKGQGSEDMTIDCHEASLGYTYNNMRMISQHDNCVKGQVEKSMLHQKNEEWYEAFMKEIDEEREKRSQPYTGDAPPF